MMSYEDSAQLMRDPIFKDRCKVAVLKFADAIVNEPTATAGHNARLRWAQQGFAQPDMVAGTVQPPTVMDAAVQANGKNVTDEQLQGAVEAVVNKTL